MVTPSTEWGATDGSDRPVTQLAVMVFVGLAGVVATMQSFPELALLACSLTVVAAAWTLHVAIRRIHRAVVALDDAVSALALDSAADRNTVIAALGHAKTLTTADRAWLVADIGDDVTSVGIDLLRLTALDATEFDRSLFDERRPHAARHPRKSGAPCRHVLVAELPVHHQRVMLVVGRDRRFAKFTQPDADLLERWARHAGAAMTQRQVRGELEAEMDRHRIAASHDSLTGLLSRDQFRELVAESLDRGAGAAVALVGLHAFKRINDHFGLQTGDQFLGETAQRIRSTLPGGAVAARLGGDEFAVLIPEARSEHDLTSFGESVHAALTAPMVLASNSLNVGASVGIAMSGSTGDDAGDLLRRANLAMHTAHGSGRPVELFSNALDHEIADRIALLPQFLDALSNNRLSLVYQAQVLLDDNAPVATEAELRWTAPDGRVVAPDDLARLAEAAHRGPELARWMVRRALEDCCCWWSRARPFPVAVSLTGRTIVESGLVQLVQEILHEIGLPASALRVAVTDPGVGEDLERCASVLRYLRSMGVSVALDNFGGDHSAIAPLTVLPLDQVKMAKALIRDVGRPDESDQLVRSIINLARGLGLDVIADGVESQRQADQLRTLECRIAQGMHVARPLSAIDVADWLNAQRAAPEPLTSSEPATAPARRLLFAAPAVSG